MARRDPDQELDLDLDCESENELQKLDAKYSKQFEVLTSMLEDLKKSVQSKKEPESRSRESQKRPRPADKDAKATEAEAGVSGVSPAKKNKRGQVEDSRPDSSDSEGELVGDDVDEDDEILSLADEDEEFLASLDDELADKEKTSKRVASSLANHINKRFAGKLSDEKLKERMEKYHRPSNCEHLVVPTVNPEVWKSLPAHARRADLKLAQTQRAIVKAATALTKTTHILLSARNQDKEVTTANADALTLLGHASRELSLRRRQAIKPHLNRELTGLCSDAVPITSQLFGDTLSASLKEIKELDRLSNSVAGTSGFRKQRPQWSQERRPFLGRKNWRQEWTPKKRAYNNPGWRGQRSRPQFHQKKAQ